LKNRPARGTPLPSARRAALTSPGPPPTLSTYLKHPLCYLFKTAAPPSPLQVHPPLRPAALGLAVLLLLLSALSLSSNLFPHPPPALNRQLNKKSQKNVKIQNFPHGFSAAQTHLGLRCTALPSLQGSSPQPAILCAGMNS
jgi:hypothetical protein